MGCVQEDHVDMSLTLLGGEFGLVSDVSAVWPSTVDATRSVKQRTAKAYSTHYGAQLS